MHPFKEVDKTYPSSDLQCRREKDRQQVRTKLHPLRKYPFTGHHISFHFALQEPYNFVCPLSDRIDEYFHQWQTQNLPVSNSSNHQ